MKMYLTRVKKPVLESGHNIRRSAYRPTKRLWCFVCTSFGFSRRRRCFGQEGELKGRR